MRNKLVPDLGTIAGYDASSSNTLNIMPLAEMERIYVEEVIAFCNGSVPKAALLLDVSPSTIYRKQLQWAKETH